MTSTLAVSVVLPTHNPHRGRLRRTLRALRAQTLPADRWETILVDNASNPVVGPEEFAGDAPDNLRVVREPQLGLTAARSRGFNEARGEFAVLVDDDNVLAPDYLAGVMAIFARQPRVGVAGGKSLPEFEREPNAWEREFLPLLALRDLGAAEIVSRPTGAAQTPESYPAFAPIGAGMALRRAAWNAWLDAIRSRRVVLTDRRGSELTSGGDNDIVLVALRAGWEVGYFPELSLTHLIPVGRLEADYLARLNRGIQQSWIRVLTLHGVCPWPPLSRLGAALRKLKAWFVLRAWSSPASRIRWQGVRGHFDGRAG